MFDLPPMKRRSTWLRRAVAAATGVVVIGGAALVVHADDDADAALRTAVATNGDVDHRYSGVATIEPLSQALVAFPSTGTVASVDVVIGDIVAIGQQLATLDTVELERELRAKQEALAQANLVLSVALDGDDPSSLLQGSGQGPVGFASPAAVSSAIASSADGAGIDAAQQAVLDAQHGVDVATANAASAMSSAVGLCSAIATSADPTGAIAACQTALEAVVTAQQAVSTAQADVSAAATELDGLLAAWSSELESASSATTVPAPPTTTTGAESPATENATAPTGSNGGGTVRATSAPSGTSGTTTNTPTAQDLIAYQYSVDAAQFAVEAAEQALAQTTIVSPIAGTVTEVNISAGDDISAASTTQTIVVEGTGGFEATTTVSINDIADFEVGQAATVVPDGSTTPLTGEVVAIASTPEASSTSYRVTVGLADPTQESAGLRNGNIGSVDIVTASSSGAVVVPTSAVRLVGTQHVVTIVDEDRTTTTVPVAIGTIGDAQTEVTSGVDAGDVVVLAELDG